MRELDCFNSYLEVDLCKMMHNIHTIQRENPKAQVIPVLKCNGYGMGALPMAKVLCADGVSLFAVAQVQEALELRRSGITAGILVLGGIPEHNLPAAVHHNIQITVFSTEGLAALAQEVKKANKRDYPIQIKIETGLNRIGARVGAELDALVQSIKDADCFSVVGVFTHFIDGERENSAFASGQLTLYEAALRQLEALGISPQLRHVCASGSSQWCTNGIYNALRIGRRLSMDSPLLPGSAPPTGVIEEICSWRAFVVNLRNLQQGESVGYGAKYIAKKPMQVATISAGYGDGLQPALANGGAPVLVGEHTAALIGTCMDQCFADVTGLDCALGDEVTFFGSSQGGRVLSIQELASRIGHEGVFLTSVLAPRVKRVYRTSRGI